MDHPAQEFAKVNVHLFTADGRFPNNAELPLLIYKRAIDERSASAPEIIRLFEKNGWANAWTNGIYDYHHFHSNTHEVLGVAAGEATIQFGGTDGIVEELGKGDVVLIPAGVAHKCIHATEDFSVVGAYPGGQDYDLQTAEEGETNKEAFENNTNVSVPEKDPVYGNDGPLIEYWQPDEALLNSESKTL